MYDYYLFDLDGTLTDPGEGITKAVAYALKHFGIDIKDRTILYPFIGPPLRDSFKKYYGFSAEQAERAVALYREYYRETGIYENILYPQIPQTLNELKKRGKILAVATSKPEELAKIVLDHFNIRKYFDFVGGALFEKSRDRKKDVIKYVIESMNIPDLNKVVMIGDRDLDILGAKENGIHSIGVLYGYGNMQEFTNAGAEQIIRQPLELL